MLSRYDVDGIQYRDMRDKLYFNKYKYRARIFIPGLNGYYNARSYASACVSISKLDDRYYSIQKNLFENNKEQVKRWFTWRDSARDKIAEGLVMIMRTANSGSVYSNDLEILRTLDSLGASVDYTVVESIAVGTLYFARKPKHNYRMYMRNTRVDADSKQQLLEWLLKKSTDYHMSSALRGFLNYNRRYVWNRYHMRRDFYVEYDSEHMGSYLKLIWGEYFSDTYQLLKQSTPYETPEQSTEK